MNYAEDRLDRRARMIDNMVNINAHEQSIHKRLLQGGKSDHGLDTTQTRGPFDSSTNLYGEQGSLQELGSNPSQDCASLDLDDKANRKSWSENSLVMDLNHAHAMIHAGHINPNHNEAIYFLKMGHELAGRTLRDCGLCAHASFHYAMAWMSDGSDAERAGIYK